MKEKKRWAFVLDKDEFVRLSLNKILQKYGFQVEEIEDLSELGMRRREVKEGMILADLEVAVIERWLPFLRRWSDRFILLTSSMTDEVTHRLKKIGIRRIIKKPVDPRGLKKMIREISFPEDLELSSSCDKNERILLQSERR